ncbi:MAG: acyl-CoA dehydrogenase [Desulfobacterales bacterium]|jgi:alkylation response protein AidB-like acyl-CoA dehydrogenase|nr:acyl-CoA dehydrogenase [Desulfobacterales bacterium]
MAQVIADRRDVDFVLHEQFQVDVLCKAAQFAEFDKKVVDRIIAEARNLAIKELLPTLKIGDELGCSFDKETVSTPAEYKRAWHLLTAGEWLALTRDPQWGGQGMPEVVSLAAKDYLIGGNIALMMFAGLTHGAARLIEVFGTEQQKAIYLKKMYTGQWTGTMLLTEAEAGSDLGALTTTAVKNPDGTYTITGNKIFISGGEHDLTENIIHPTLARIEGAPEGSRGISLFLVPKYLVHDDGSLGARNDIICTGIERKIGLHGNATCAMALGSRGKCIGTLLGQENKGLAAMFIMMNEERLAVGLQALSCASSSYLHALSYARQRIQGVMLGSRDKASVAIVNHPDVRRMLLTMKMYVEGMRSLLYFVGLCEDKKHIAQSEEQKEIYQDLIDVLIPVAKGYVSDRAVEVCDMGVQVFGGYGYIREYPVGQLLCDVRVCPIYEGTNGIQAMDLLGRKLGMKQGNAFKHLLGRMQKTIAEAKAAAPVAELAEKLTLAVGKLGETAMHLGMTAMGPDVKKAFSFACPFLQVIGDVTMAWMLLWRATVAAQKLEKTDNKRDIVFYEGQLKSAEYFIKTVLPVTLGRMRAIGDTCGAAVEISDDSLGGK